MSISAIVITRNEEKMLAGCLKKLNWVDEIVVVDSESQDKTVEIAKKYHAKTVSVLAQSDYSYTRNQGKKIATGDWLLYIDADERVSEDLKKEIMLSISNNLKPISYKIPRQNIMLSKWVKHGGFWPDYVPRLFHKDALVKWSGKLHESPTTKGEVKTLKSPIKHYTARSITSALNKSSQWSQIEARLNYNAKAPKVTWWRMFKAFILKFFKLYIIKKGFLDGARGFVLAYIQSFHDLSILVGLWQLQRE